MTTLADIATLRGAPVVGLWRDLARDVLDVLERVRAVDGDLARLATPGGRPLLVAKHPRDIRRALVENAANGGRTPFHDRLRVALGNGLSNSEGMVRERRRRKLQPLFHAGAPVARWRAAAAGAVVEVERDLSGLAMAIVGRALFGDDADHGDICEAVAVAESEVARRQFRPVQPPRRMPAPGERRPAAAAARRDHAAARAGAAAGGVAAGVTSGAAPGP